MKGNLICKRLKTNPSIVTLAKAVSAGEELIFKDPERQVLRASEVPLKPRESGFGSPLVLKDGWDLYRGIDECRIIDIPKDADNEVHEDVERLSLFDEKEGQS